VRASSPSCAGLRRVIWRRPSRLCTSRLSGLLFQSHRTVKGGSIPRGKRGQFGVSVMSYRRKTSPEAIFFLMASSSAIKSGKRGSPVSSNRGHQASSLLFGCTILTLFGAHLADNSGRLRRRRTRVPRAATTPRSTIAMGDNQTANEMEESLVHPLRLRLIQKRNGLALETAWRGCGPALFRHGAYRFAQRITPCGASLRPHSLPQCRLPSLVFGLRFQMLRRRSH
jgi:hypothetical protein